MNWTKGILAFYPALLVTSLHLTERGMADQLDLTPRADEWLWLVGFSVLVPAIHLFALRHIRHDRPAYRKTAALGLLFIIIPFIGLVVGIAIYGVLTYLLATRGRNQDFSSRADS